MLTRIWDNKNPPSWLMGVEAGKTPFLYLLRLSNASAIPLIGMELRKTLPKVPGFENLQECSGSSIWNNLKLEICSTSRMDDFRVTRAMK